MSIKNILIFVMLISIGCHETVQAETLREMKIPDLDISATLGKWYGLTSSNGNDNIACSTMTLGPLSGRGVTMNSTFYETGKAPYSLIFDCPLAENSNVLVCDKGGDGKMIAVMFIIEYNSHLAMYTTSFIANAGSGNNGYVFVMGREKQLPAGVLGQVENTKFYKEGMKPGVTLHAKRVDGCP